MSKFFGGLIILIGNILLRVNAMDPLVGSPGEESHSDVSRRISRQNLLIINDADAFPVMSVKKQETKSRPRPKSRQKLKAKPPPVYPKLAGVKLSFKTTTERCLDIQPRKVMDYNDADTVELVLDYDARRKREKINNMSTGSNSDNSRDDDSDETGEGISLENKTSDENRKKRSGKTSEESPSETDNIIFSESSEDSAVQKRKKRWTGSKMAKFKKQKKEHTAEKREMMKKESKRMVDESEEESSKEISKAEVSNSKRKDVDPVNHASQKDKDENEPILLRWFSKNREDYKEYSYKEHNPGHESPNCPACGPDRTSLWKYYKSRHGHPVEYPNKEASKFNEVDFTPQVNTNEREKSLESDRWSRGHSLEVHPAEESWYVTFPPGNVAEPKNQFYHPTKSMSPFLRALYQSFFSSLRPGLSFPSKPSSED